MRHRLFLGISCHMTLYVACRMPIFFLEKNGYVAVSNFMVASPASALSAFITGDGVKVINASRAISEHSDAWWQQITITPCYRRRVT